MKELAMLNHLKYWPFIFRYSSLTCIKFHLIVSKLDPLDSRNKMMLIKLSFILTPNIEHLFCVILLAFMIFLALVVLGITFSKQKVCYMKRQLNMLGLIIIVLFTNISTTGQVSKICLILRICIRLFLHDPHFLKLWQIWFKNSTH